MKPRLHYPKLSLREAGFRAGYSDWTQEGFPPPARFKFDQVDTIIWLEAWAEGRTLAKRHRAEKCEAIRRLNEVTA